MKVLSLMAIAMIGLLPAAQAQSPKTAAAQKPTANTATPSTENDDRWLFDKYYGYVSSQAKAGKDVMQAKDAAKLADYINTEPALKAKKAKLYRQDYKRADQYKTVSGESDRIMLLKGIPEPKGPAAALQSDPRENETYANRIQHYKERAQEEARKIANSTDLMKTYHRDGQDAVKKQFEDKANQSEIVQDMGGARALQNMSEKEREEAAKKMVARQTGGYTAEQIQQMTPAQRQALAYQMAANRNSGNGKGSGNEDAAAFTQKLMNDPAYRAAYEKMSNSEKQKVYQEFLESRGSGPTVPKVTKEMKESEQDAREILEIAKISEQFYAELKKLFDPIAQLELRYSKETDAKLQFLAQWVSEETEKLPTVRDSEYGPRKDGIERVLFMEAVFSFQIGQDRIAKEREVWNKYLDAHITAFEKLDEWIAVYEKRNDLSDRLKLQLAELKIAGYDTILEFNKRAGFITGSAGSVQYSYNCQALRDCHDPRQDKYSNGQ